MLFLRPSAPTGYLPVAMWSFLQRLFKSQPPRDALGERGENVAARHLRNLGYKIVVRNFRCSLGEIDIVARDGKTLVFAEVKTREFDDPTPEDQVNPFKRH